MKKISTLILELVLGAAVIMLMGHLFEGDVIVKDFQTAFLVALVLALLNTFVKPILSFLAFPVTFMSFGLFQLVINGFILTLATDIMKPDFMINGFGTTIIVSICISILYSILGIGKLND